MQAGSSTDGPTIETFDPKTIDRSKPWSGATPPVSLLGAGGGVACSGKPDGVWRSRNAKGSLYPIDRNGSQW